MTTSQPEHVETLHTVARRDHANGIVLIPVGANKRTDLKGWPTYQTTEDDLERWFGGPNPRYEAMAAVCGHDGLTMVEIEADYVYRLKDVQAQIVTDQDRQLWRRFNTWLQQSGGGGLHWIIKVDSGDQDPPRNTKLASTADGQTIAETRGRGGYFILAPSSGTAHPSGNGWKNLVGGSHTVETFTLEEFETVLGWFRALDETPARETAQPAATAPVSSPQPSQPSEPFKLIQGGYRGHQGFEDDGLAPGADFERQVSWEELLGREGWQKHHVDGQTTYWTRPGKPVSEGPSATTGYSDTGDRFYPFTTSTEFEAGQPYSKFAVYTMFTEGSNTPEAFSRAASKLREQGYGTSSTPKVATSLETVAQDGTSDPLDPVESSWAPIDLTPYLDGSYTPPVASLMERTDGPCLLYPGKVHSLSGESESGKSMIATAEAAQQLKNGQPVLFLDYESDAATVVDRLLKMGVTKEAILAHFDYRLPEVDPVTSAAHDIHQWADLLSNTYSLAVLDGVTEALGISGASSMDNDEVTHWIRTVPRAIADKTGAATLLIDHVTKSRETRGRFAIGAQSKLSALSGAAYIVEPIEPLGVGLLGILQIKVAKDRPGQVRPHSKGWDKKDRLAIIAEAIVDSTNPLVIDYQLDPPSEQLSPDDVQREAWDDLKARIVQEIGDLHNAQNVKPSFSKLNKSVKGRTENIREALEELIQEGRVLSQPGQRNAMFLSLPERPV